MGRSGARFGRCRLPSGGRRGWRSSIQRNPVCRATGGTFEVARAPGCGALVVGAVLVLLVMAYRRWARRRRVRIGRMHELHA